MVINNHNRALLWPTYTCHLSDCEDTGQQEHLDRNREDEDEGKSQRGLRGHDGPQDGQTHHLDTGEEMHAQRSHLEKQQNTHR